MVYEIHHLIFVCEERLLLQYNPLSQQNLVRFYLMLPSAVKSLLINVCLRLCYKCLPEIRAWQYS